MSAAWPRVRLGEVLRQRKEFIVIDDTQSYRRPRVQLHAQGVVLRDEVPGALIKTKSQQVCRAGEFLVAEIDAKMGGFGLVPPELQGSVVSNHYFLFVVDESRLMRGFLGWFAKTTEFRRQVEAQGSTNYAAIRPSDVLGYEIPLPPLAEQRRIVARLESVALAVEQAQALQRGSDLALDSLVSATVANLVEGEEAPVRPLNDLLIEPPRNGLGPRPETANGLPMLRISAVSSSPNRDVDVSAVKRVDVRESDAAPYFAREQDVFVVRYNGDINRLARAALFREQPGTRCIYPDKLIRLRPDPRKLLPEFLVLAFGSRLVRDRVEQMGKTTAGNLGISGKDIKSFLVPVPPLEVQARLVRQVDRISDLVTVGKATAQVRGRTLDALLPATLDCAFAGRL